MNVITVQIPGSVADLICSSTPQAAFDGMIENNGLPYLEMKTFGMVITPIIKDETGVEWAHVVLWHNKMISVTRYTPGDEFLPLVGIVEWHGESYPTCVEALETFYRFGSEFEEIPF